MQKVRGIVASYGGDSQYPHAGQETGCEWFPSMKKEPQVFPRLFLLFIYSMNKPAACEEGNKVRQPYGQGGRHDVAFS